MSGKSSNSNNNNSSSSGAGGGGGSVGFARADEVPSGQKPIQGFEVIKVKCESVLPPQPVLELPVAVANMIPKVCEMVNEYDMSEVEIGMVDGPTMQLCVEFLEKMIENKVVSYEAPLEDWQVVFFDEIKAKSKAKLAAFMNAADYLECSALLRPAAKYTARDLTKLTTVEQVRAYLGITDEFTAEEMAAVQAEEQMLVDLDQAAFEELTAAMVNTDVMVTTQ